MLLVDFLQPAEEDADPDDQQQQQLNFIPLPHEALQSRRPYIDEGAPDPFQCAACATDAASIKLVCIITKTRVQHSASHLVFTIATWTLDISRGEWRKDSGAAMDDGEFFGLYDEAAGQKNLPRVLPSFPVVSLVDPDVVSFLLKEGNGVYWMVEVNMCHKKLQSSAVYIKEEEEGDEGCLTSKKKVCRNFFDGDYFIPSQFSAYLSKDAIAR